MKRLREKATYLYLKDFYAKQGLTVLNSNDAGYPDLAVFEDHEFKFFVEVKQGFYFYSLPRQMKYHDYLKEIGFDVKNLFFNMDNRTIELKTKIGKRLVVNSGSQKTYRDFDTQKIGEFTIHDIELYETLIYYNLYTNTP